MGPWSPRHWTTREVPKGSLIVMRCQSICLGRTEQDGLSRSVVPQGQASSACRQGLPAHWGNTGENRPHWSQSFQFHVQLPLTDGLMCFQHYSLLKTPNNSKSFKWHGLCESYIFFYMSGAIAKENVFLVFLPREIGQSDINMSVPYNCGSYIHMVHAQWLSGVLPFATI